MKAILFSASIPQVLALKALRPFGRRPYYQGPLATVRLADIPEPGLPSPQWVKIKTFMCGVCASDLNLIFLKESLTASPFTSFPCVLGHEVCGQVVETGDQVNGFEIGDMVTLCPSLHCRTRGIDPVCPACRAGRIAHCENLAKGNIAPGMFTGICKDTGGGFAPYFVAHQSQLFKLPQGVTIEDGAMIEPLSVALQAVFSNRPRAGERVLVIGGGVLGSLIVRSIRALGIDCRITVADPSVYAAGFAHKAGANSIVTNGDIFDAAVQFTGAERYKPLMGPDLLQGGFARIYDVVGTAKTINTSLKCLASGGRLSIVGLGPDVKLDLTPLWLKGQTMVGVYGCNHVPWQGRLRHMFEIALELVSQKKVYLGDMITHRFALHELDKIIETNLAKSRHRAMKTAICHVSPFFP